MRPVINDQTDAPTVWHNYGAFVTLLVHRTINDTPHVALMDVDLLGAMIEDGDLPTDVMAVGNDGKVYPLHVGITGGMVTFRTPGRPENTFAIDLPAHLSNLRELPSAVPEAVEALRATGWPSAFEHPTMSSALDDWCELVGIERANAVTDADLAQVASVMDQAGLLSFRDKYGHNGEMSPTAYHQAAELAALVLLAGAHLAELAGLELNTATARAAQVVATQLGRPTGYEGEPDRLARKIHENTFTEVSTDTDCL